MTFAATIVGLSRLGISAVVFGGPITNEIERQAYLSVRDQCAKSG